ncbi:MAG: RNA methyltransferase [Myxococcota bacterium]
MRRVHTALVHHPVRARSGDTVTTAITNLDVHDLARSSRTYDVARFFVVTPVQAQRRLAQAILDHWGEAGPGTARIPERYQALSRCEIVASVDDAVRAIEDLEGRAPRLVATAARPTEGIDITPFPEAGRVMSDSGVPHLILFGTGHGLADSIVRQADVLLPPIRAGSYNHLSVRAAAAIVLDRLFGEE